MGKRGKADLDERARRVGYEMRQCLFREFGEPSAMTEAEMDDVLRTMVAIHTGEVIEFAARFCYPRKSVRQGCIAMIDLMLEHNKEEIDKLKGNPDRLACLTNVEKPKDHR